MKDELDDLLATLFRMLCRDAGSAFPDESPYMDSIELIYIILYKLSERIKASELESKKFSGLSK